MVNFAFIITLQKGPLMEQLTSLVVEIILSANYILYGIFALFDANENFPSLFLLFGMILWTS
jgi:hypothetical protein